MSQSDKLKLARWKQVSKNPEFEDPTDPFQPHRRRYKIELDRYLNNVNLNYMPPMPRPVYKNARHTKIETQREVDTNIFKNNKALSSNNKNISNSNLTNLNQMNVTRSSNFS